MGLKQKVIVKKNGMMRFLTNSILMNYIEFLSIKSFGEQIIIGNL